MSQPYNSAPQALHKPPTSMETLISRYLQKVLNESPWRNFLRKFDTTNSNGCTMDSIDALYQEAGECALARFQKAIEDLDWELHNVAIKARQLRGTLAVGMQSSARDLREHLAILLFLCEQNATRLFPDKVIRPYKSWTQYLEFRTSRLYQKERQKPSLQGIDSLDSKKPKIDKLPSYMETLADGLTTFLDCLNEYPDPKTENLSFALFQLSSDLKYWASCLEKYEDQFTNSVAVKQYVHDITCKIDGRLGKVTTELPAFTDSGLPTIIKHQKEEADNLVMLATFFTATAATTLQFSYTDTETPLFTTVNTFWFLALVLSLGAAGTGLVSMSCKRVMNQHSISSWILVWVTRSPLILVVLAFGCFSVGIVLFAYSSGQNKILSTLVAVLSGCSCFLLAVLSFSIITKRLEFRQVRGEKHTISWWKRIYLAIGSIPLPKLSSCSRRFKSLNQKGRRLLPFSMNDWPMHRQDNLPEKTSSFNSALKRRRMDILMRLTIHSSRLESSLKAMKPKTQEIEVSIAPVTSMQFSPNGKFLAIASLRGELSVTKINDDSLKPQTVSLDGPISKALWSPDSKYLLLKLKERIQLRNHNNEEVDTYFHEEAVVSMAWMPQSTGFLCAKASVIEEHHLRISVHPPSAPVYYSKRHVLDGIDLHDVAMGCQSELVVCVGTLAASHDDLKPSTKNRAEKRLLVYNLKTRKTEAFVPILHDVQSIAVSESQEYHHINVLVSYHKTPPQLWRILTENETTQISLRHTYMPTVNVNFAGPAIFGGNKDQLVLCGTDVGDIFIWHRISAAFLHHIPAARRRRTLYYAKHKDQPTCIAWNKLDPDAFMLAAEKPDAPGHVELWIAGAPNGKDPAVDSKATPVGPSSTKVPAEDIYLEGPDM